MDEQTRYVLQTAENARARCSWTVARLAYQVAVSLQPLHAPAWAGYAEALVESGDPRAGIDAARKALSLSPASVEARTALAQALMALGEYQAALSHLDEAIATHPEAPAPRRVRHRLRRLTYRREPGLPSRLRYLIIGTTSICNASCVHCPTGKASTDHVPRLPMAMEHFRAMLEGIDALGLEITNQISFGLFGDSLADPQVVERARMARTIFPDTEIVVNTNAAAFNPRRHAALADSDVIISLHCESLDPEVYGELMRPLRLERVLPKYLQMLEAFPGRVNVSVPVSRRNLAELPAIRAWFEERGARCVTMDPISSRCRRDLSVFTALALKPVRIRCPPTITEDLIVDADGQVLLCCQDFERIEGVGDLTRQSVREILLDPRRHRAGRLLGEGRHDEIETCSRCYGDLRPETTG